MTKQDRNEANRLAWDKSEANRLAWLKAIIKDSKRDEESDQVKEIDN